MTDTATRPLPTTRALLNAWLPAEPETGVSRARAGARRIDALVRDASAKLEQHDRDERNRIDVLADAAIDGTIIDTHDAVIAATERQVLEAALDRLRRARQLVSHRQAVAARSDPRFIDWQGRCRRLEEEWTIAMSAGTDVERFNALVAFTERHRPS